MFQALSLQLLQLQQQRLRSEQAADRHSCCLPVLTASQICIKLSCNEMQVSCSNMKCSNLLVWLNCISLHDSLMHI